MEQTGKAFLRSSRHAALLALCYFAAVMIPNCILFFPEPYSIWSKAALLTLPAGEPTDRTLLKSPRISVDRSGGFVPELVELSDVLPPQVFDVRNFL